MSGLKVNMAAAEKNAATIQTTDGFNIADLITALRNLQMQFGDIPVMSYDDKYQRFLPIHFVGYDGKEVQLS